MHSRKLRSYLDSAGVVAGLMPQAERLIELRRLYRALVPQQLLRSSSIVNYKQQRVVIFAENNAVAGKLRLLTPRLVNDFAQSGVEVTGIRVEVQPRNEAPAAAAAKHARLSPSGAQSLAALAQRLPEGELKRVIQNFATKDKP